MALPPGSPDTFMREVDDAVREDRLRTFFADYGKAVIALVIVGLAALGGWLYWDHHQGRQAGALGAQLNTAIDALGQGRPNAAATGVDSLAKGDDPAYAALALMVQGNAAAAGGDMRTAAARFAAVSANADVPQALRDAALLREILAQYDTMQPATVIARLRHLVAEPGPAFASAAELTALAELKRGNEAAAGALFKRIAESDDAPESLKSRAVQMAGMLGVDAVGDIDEDEAPAASATGAGNAPAAAATGSGGAGE
ncbi:MAG: tetratricopeptide repeat protein [Sphingopyxis sp.]|nr:tetratricopeptide repeat protein [Sphingopyxis sp.]